MLEWLRNKKSESLMKKGEEAFAEGEVETALKFCEQMIGRGYSGGWELKALILASQGRRLWQACRTCEACCDTGRHYGDNDTDFKPKLLGLRSFLHGWPLAHEIQAASLPFDTPLYPLIR